MTLANQVQNVLLIIGHIAVAVAYLGIAIVLWRYVKATERDARVVTQMFRLFSYFIGACGIQHIFAALAFHYPLIWIYTVSLWLTAALALATLIFTWYWRPVDPNRKDIVIAKA